MDTSSNKWREYNHRTSIEYYEYDLMASNDNQTEAKCTGFQDAIKEIIRFRDNLIKNEVR